MDRMQHEATELGAEGIVGVQLIEKSHFWGSHVIEFLAIGTAVRPIRADHVIEDMVKLLGGHAENIEAPFDPEAGAYAGGHSHAHDDDGHGHHHG